MAIGWTLAPVYFVQEVGMDPLQLVLTGTFMEIAYFLFEVPTGIVADSYSRRVSVIVAQAIMGIAFVVTGLVTSVPLILAAAALMGFGWTFKSGAIDAWLADEVGPERLGREYQRGAQVGRIFTLVGIGAAVALALVDLRLPIVAGGLVLIALGAFLVFAMPESAFERGHARGGLGASFHDGHRAAGRQAHLGTADPSPDHRDHVLRRHVERERGQALGGALPHGHRCSRVRRVQLDRLVRRAERRGGRARDRRRAAALPPLLAASWRGMTWSLFCARRVMVGTTLAFAFAVSFGAAVLAYWGICVARSLAAPIYSTWLNANIEDSSVRATVISMTNLGDSAGEWGGGPALGARGQRVRHPRGSRDRCGRCSRRHSCSTASRSVAATMTTTSTSFPQAEA